MGRGCNGGGSNAKIVKAIKNLTLKSEFFHA
nr:MAG TPA: hypothetical protein [Caudoviricetes sp.]